MYKPLMMMRTKGLTGPRFAKHANLQHHIARSAGNSAGGLILRPTIGWNGDVNCAVACDPPFWEDETNVLEFLPGVYTSESAVGDPWPNNLQNYGAGTPPLSYRVVGGTIPAGITLNSNGLFSGVMESINSSDTVTYEVSNACGTSTIDQFWSHAIE